MQRSPSPAAASTDTTRLRAAWADAWRAIGIQRPTSSADDPLLAQLLARYAEPHRHYHSLQHLDECLALLDAHREAAERPAEVALALWFHDAIYDVHRHDNEAQSATWAFEALTAAGLPEESARRVHDLVMATRHDAVPEGHDAALLVDIDLAILGATPPRFAEYERQIRTEYAHVAQPLFEERRRAILSRFLERQPIYLTPGLRSEREAQARTNLQSAVGVVPTAAPSAEALLALAIQRVNAGDRAQARALCDQALIAHAPHPAVLQLLAFLMLQDGEIAQARDHITQSLAMRPAHGPTLALAGDIARAAGAPTEALAFFERAHGLQPDRAERRHAVGAAWFELALKRQDTGDLAGAAAALRSALFLLPQYAEAEVNLGIVLQESGDFASAMQAYGRAYRLREDTFGRIAHALAAANTGRLWLDLDALRAALRSAPAA